MTCCFAPLGARALLPTRLDLVRRLGGVPAAADAGRLALSAAGVTPQFAYGLHPLTPLLLSRRLFSGAHAAAPQPASATPARQILVGPDQSSQRRCSAPPAWRCSDGISCRRAHPRSPGNPPARGKAPRRAAPPHAKRSRWLAASYTWRS